MSDNDTNVTAVLWLIAHLLVQGGQLAVWLQINGTTYIIDKDDNLKDVRDTIENESMMN